MVWERVEDCSLLPDSSKFCRALLALLPSSYSIPSAGQRCEALVTSAVPKKNWKTAGERQNHSADTSTHPRRARPTWVPGSSLGGLGAVQLRRYGRWVQQSYTLIRCIVPSNTQADNRQGQAAAPLMICLEPSSVSLGNLEIRHGPGPGALLNADRPTHLASQAQDQARGGSPSLGRNVLDSHPSYAGAGRYVMGREARQHLTRQQQRPKSRIPIGLLTRSPFLQPSSSIERATTTTSTGLPERSRCFEGRTITPVSCFSRETALDCLTYLDRLTFVYL